MAKDWYLIGSRTHPNVLGGFENESFLDYKSDAFSESLNTEIGTEVLLCNSDLREKKKMRIIVQGNVADTVLKGMERTILAPIGTLKAGMYIWLDNAYWLITGFPGNNGMYEKAVMSLCQYKLKWLNGDGEIIERYANFTSASKYDVGESGNSSILLSSNNFTILIPEDDDGYSLEGKRVFIDRHVKSPRKVFKITRSDDVLYLYGKMHGGILSFIADKTELNLLVDNPELGLCDYYGMEIPKNDLDESTKNIIAVITGGKILRCNRNKTWTVSFKDSDENEISYDLFKWEIDSNITISSKIDGNKIKLFSDRDIDVGNIFDLYVKDGDGNIMAQQSIELIEAF